MEQYISKNQQGNFKIHAETDSITGRIWYNAPEENRHAMG